METRSIWTLFGISEESIKILLAYTSVIIIASWGGVSAYLIKIKRFDLRFSISELIGEIVISSFIGFTVALLLKSAGAPDGIIWGSAGLCGHMGSRAIYLLEILTLRYVKKSLNLDLKEEEITSVTTRPFNPTDKESKGENNG